LLKKCHWHSIACRHIWCQYQWHISLSRICFFWTNYIPVILIIKNIVHAVPFIFSVFIFYFFPFRNNKDEYKVEQLNEEKQKRAKYSVTQVFDNNARLIYKQNLVKITWIIFQKINENNKYKVCTQNICCWLKLETGDM